MNSPETNIPTVERTKSRRLKTTAIIGAAALSAGLVAGGVSEYVSADKPRHTTSSVDTPTPTPETQASQENTEQRAAQYKQEAIAFAKTTVDKLSDASLETNPQGSENTTYQLSNIPESELQVMEPGQERKRIVVTLNLGKHTIDIAGVDESRNEGMKNQVKTKFELDDDNPVFDANPDAPITYQDFVTAINGVEMDDVRSIIVFGQGISDQINGEFTPGKPPVFTNGEKPRADIPTQQQIHEVIKAVQP